MSGKEQEQARERIEDARAEAAAYIVQRAPVEKVDSGEQEDVIVEALDAAIDENDPAKLDDLADEAEEAASEIREEAYGHQPEKS